MSQDRQPVTLFCSCGQHKLHTALPASRRSLLIVWSVCQIERELREMGIIDLCGFADPLYTSVKGAKLLSKKTAASEQQLSSTAVLTQPVPVYPDRHPSFASWDDTRISAIRSSSGESLKHIAKHADCLMIMCMVSGCIKYKICSMYNILYLTM